MLYKAYFPQISVSFCLPSFQFLWLTPPTHPFSYTSLTPLILHYLYHLKLPTVSLAGSALLLSQSFPPLSSHFSSLSLCSILNHPKSSSQLSTPLPHQPVPLCLSSLFTTFLSFFFVPTLFPFLAPSPLLPSCVSFFFYHFKIQSIVQTHSHPLFPCHHPVASHSAPSRCPPSLHSFAV